MQPPEVFCKKGVLRNFAKFTGKHLCQRLFFRSLVQENFAKFLRTPFLQNISGQLLQNGHAKVLITHILYRRTTPGEYLEPSRTSTVGPFCKKKPSAIFFKNFPPQMLDWVLNNPSERLLQEWEYMTNSPFLMI